MSPSFARTPESLLSGLRRSDSKNPLTTCHGTTASGRPCRRSLAAAVNALNNAIEASEEDVSVVAVLEERDHGSEVTAFFCWQHKDQADAYHADRARRVQLTTRGSLEDMMSNMGLRDSREIRAALDKHPQRKQRSYAPAPSASDIRTAPPAGNHGGAARTEGGLHEKARSGHDRSSRVTRPQQRSLWDLICGCHGGNAQLRGELDHPRPRQRPSGSSARRDPPSEKASLSNAPERRESTIHVPKRDTAAFSTPYLQVRPPLRAVSSQPKVTRKPLSSKSAGHSKRSASAGDATALLPPANKSPINDALAVIPRAASINLASALMAEMGKVSQDHREGYIYMYWLEQAQRPHADDDGQSLLTTSPSGSNRPAPDPKRVSKLLLKIGRAENVHRRLSQWQLQCGLKPLLVRTYPRAGSGDKVRHLHRVERLIHTELSELNVRRQCDSCAREHREWFEVDGREGVRAVDRIIEKWIAWSARHAGS